MRIKTRISQYRRDFTADYECESCGHVQRGYGYDDANFHTYVIPAMKCIGCGATATGPSSHPIIPAGVVL